MHSNHLQKRTASEPPRPLEAHAIAPPPVARRAVSPPILTAAASSAAKSHPNADINTDPRVPHLPIIAEQLVPLCTDSDTNPESNNNNIINAPSSVEKPPPSSIVAADPN